MKKTIISLALAFLGIANLYAVNLASYPKVWAELLKTVLRTSLQ